VRCHALSQKNLIRKYANDANDTNEYVMIMNM